jgi:hypothetical protein
MYLLLKSMLIEFVITLNEPEKVTNRRKHALANMIPVSVTLVSAPCIHAL